MKNITKTFKNKQGLSAVEYILLSVILLAVITGVIGAVGKAIQGQGDRVTGIINEAK
jgi:Flp pilus assembly pilin Flp